MKVIPALILFLVPTFCLAAPNLGTFEHSIAGKQYKFILNGEIEERQVNEIQIFCPGQVLPCQSLKNDGDPLPDGEGVEAFSFMDLNFDENDDIALVASYGVTGNVFYNVWLYNPATNRFDYNDELSSLGAPDPDPDKKLINTYSKGGYAGCERDEAVYSFKNGELELESQTEYLFDEEQCKFVVIERLRQGDKVMEMSRKENDECKDLNADMPCGEG